MPVLSLAMTSQGDLPATLMRAAVQFDVAESDFLLLQHYGMHSLNAMAFKLPKAEDLEVFLKDLVLGLQAYKQEDGVVVTFQRTPPERWEVWKMSNDAAAIRRLWTYSRETAKGEVERMAAGEDSKRKTTLVELVAMETAALARGCTPPASDRERVSLYTLNKVSKALVPASYDVVPWEAYISKEEEDKLMREGKLPKTSHTELVLSKESKVIAKDAGDEILKHLPKVGDMEYLRAKLDLRARALEMVDLARFNTLRALSDKYYGKMNATVAAGMRCPTMNEVRRFDREMQTLVYRHLSRGEGTLQDALQFYVESDDGLWRLLDPVISHLPDQGIEETSKDPSKTDDKKRKREEPAERSSASSPPEKKLKLCVVCKKHHEPLCPLPEGFRKEQREKRRQKKAEAKAKAKSG